MDREVIFLGGNLVDENFPAVLWPKISLEEAGYEVTEVIELFSGIQDMSLGDLEQDLESHLKDGVKHLVGYCAGGVMALEYKNHPNVSSVTTYDVPSGIAVEGTEIAVDNSFLEDDEILIYAEDINPVYRLEGDYKVVEIQGANHEFDGRERELSQAVLTATRYNSGEISVEEAYNQLSGEKNIALDF